MFGAKSQKRLLVACDLVRFYDTIGRTVAATNVRYDIVKNFAQQWRSLKDRKDGEQLEVPKLTRELGILAWSEAIDDFLDMTIG